MSIDTICLINARTAKPVNNNHLWDYTLHNDHSGKPDGQNKMRFMQILDMFQCFYVTIRGFDRWKSLPDYVVDEK